MDAAISATKNGGPANNFGGKEGKYLYCVIGLSQPRPSLESAKALKEERGQPRTFGPLGIGERGDELYTVSFNDIAAVTSNCPVATYSLSRQNLLAHEKAIEEVMKEYTVLPIRFSTIAESEDKIKLILEKEYDNFKDLLNKLEGKKEFGLKAIFSAKGGPATLCSGKEDIYNYILEKYRDIKALKAKIETLPLEKTHYQRMEIGRMVETALQKEKEVCKEDILSHLSPLAWEVKTNNNYGERMIINAAFLVEKDKEKDFDHEVGELDVKYSNRINFKYVVTVPPFNFVNLVIETGKY